MPYRRLPKIESIDRYDPVVFNVPAGDSVYWTPGRAYYPHDLRFGNDLGLKEAVRDGRIDLITRPVDKRDHYVKRCVGLPGETLEVRSRDIYINGEKVDDPANVQYSYIVNGAPATLPEKWREMKISPDDFRYRGDGQAIMLLSNEQRDELKANNAGMTFEYTEAEAGPQYYPHDARYWADQGRDDFGPVRIPERGMTVKLDEKTFALYWRCILVYENNPGFEQRGKRFYLNDREITEYTFRMDYYWMMGDNRHNSEDSRVMGLRAGRPHSR